MSGYDPAIASLSGDVVFFPVRHHSPAAARFAEEAIVRLRPRAVLVEGPADYNEHWQELLHDHTLPIAIYSYVAWEDGERHGAFYPFCVYSPEWHAIRVAAREGIEAAFIDLPWVETCRDAGRQTYHAYADGEERRASYMLELAHRMGLENFDDLWDLLFEVDASLTLDAYMKSAHELMYYSRASAPEPALDLRREAFMAARVRERMGEGPVLVITGGYHCWGLYERLVRGNDPVAEVVEVPAAVKERGIALTPYSYERLDALTGYDAGMPNPGFYHHAWKSRESSFQTLLAQVITTVRDRKQPVSTADVIAIEALARGLAELRGQPVPWRRELVDGVKGALIKDDLVRGRHPMLDAVALALRGSARGRLARESKLPPLVADIRREIERHDLQAERVARKLELNLTQAGSLAVARVLHRLRGLGIHGYTLTQGGQLAMRGDAKQVVEHWSLQWSEEFESACIESSVYGPTLEDASRAKLEELAKEMELRAAPAASLLLESALQGHATLAAAFEQGLTTAIRSDAEFGSVCGALNTLLYLYRYDDVLGQRSPQTKALLGEAYQRALWLLESMAQVTELPAHVDEGIALLRETLLRSGVELGFTAEEFQSLLQRLVQHAEAPFLRGAAAGALWSMSFLGADEIELPAIAEPQALGDFLNGLFSLARETVQRNPELVARIDGMIQLFDDEKFLEAVPSLRLAFSVFTPREKHHIVSTLLQGRVPAKLAVGVEEAARAYAWESRLFREAARHGVLPA